MDIAKPLWPIHCDENATTRDYRRSQFVAYDATTDKIVDSGCCDAWCDGIVSTMEGRTKCRQLNRLDFRRFLFAGRLAPEHCQIDDAEVEINQSRVYSAVCVCALRLYVGLGALYVARHNQSFIYTTQMLLHMG